MPRKLQYGTLPGDGRAMQMHAASLHSLQADAETAVKGLAAEAAAVARAEQAVLPTLKAAMLAIRAMAAYIPGDELDHSSADDAMRLSISMLQTIEDERHRMLTWLEKTFAEQAEKWHRENVDVAKMLRSEYRSRSQEFWKRLEKALTSEMTTAIEEDIALYRRGMAEAAARYARHLNTFRARSKAQLAQKALAFVGVYKNHFHEVSKAMRSFDKDLHRAESGLERILAHVDAQEKEEADEIEKVMEAAGQIQAVPDNGRERHGWLYLQTSRLGGLGAAWIKHWCKYNASTNVFSALHPEKNESEKIEKPVTEQIFSKDIGNRHNVFKISQSHPPKQIIVQALSSEDRKAWINIMKGYAPLKSTRRKRGKSKSSGMLTPQSVAFLQKLISHVDANGVTEQGLYRVPGQHSRYQKLYLDAVEKGKPVFLGDEDVPTVASAIKYFFSQLAEPLFPADMYQDFLDAGREKDGDEQIARLQDLLNALPPSHLQIVKWLFQHLANVASHASVNSMDASNLGRCFGPTLLRCDDEGVGAFTNVQVQGHVVELIIQNFDKLLGSKTGLDEAAEEEEVFDEADPVDEAADTGDGGKTLERGSRLARKSVKRSAPQRPAPPPPAALSKAVSPLARRRAASDAPHSPTVGPVRSKGGLRSPVTPTAMQSNQGFASPPPSRPPQPTSRLPPPPAELLDESGTEDVTFDGEAGVAVSVDGAEAAIVVDDSRLIGYTVQALYDCEGDAEEELSFAKGQFLDHVERAPGEEGWCVGTLRETGARGLFPTNFVARVDQAEA